MHDKRHFYAYDDLQWSIGNFRLNQNKVVLPGLGARKTKEIKKVNQVLKSIKRPFKYYRLLFNLARYFKPGYILELGTSLGLGTIMLANGNQNAKVYTIEGNQTLATIAGENFKRLTYRNIDQRVGKFENELSDILQSIPHAGLAFIDGDHTYHATINHFETLLPHCMESTILIFDDIHWSREMEQAWSDIIAHQQITLSLDLFFMGIVFFNPGLSKQHFVVRY